MNKIDCNVLDQQSFAQATSLNIFHSVSLPEHVYITGFAATLWSIDKIH